MMKPFLSMTALAGLLMMVPLQAGTHSGWSDFFSLPGKPETAVETPSVSAGPQIEFTAVPCANGISFIYGIPGHAAPAAASLSIYDFNGRLIRTLSLGSESTARMVWNLRDRNNRRIGSAVYAAKLRVGNLDACKSFVVF